jgi:transposase
MITIGVDAHKQVHVARALDENGAVLDDWQGPNSADGWSSLHCWATTFAGARQWGIEGAWNYGRGLAQYLVTAGELCYEINPRWTAQCRQHTRKREKNDRLDAHAVARLVREEARTLPKVTGEDETTLLDLLTTEREGALAEATRLRNQLHQLLLQIEPQYKQPHLDLTKLTEVRRLTTYSGAGAGDLAQQRAAAVRRTATRLLLALTQAEELAAEIRIRAQAHYLPLTELCGISLLSAGALAGILGPGQRFASDAQLAAYAGVAPLEASSAGRVRHRLNRGGNRRLNALLYRMALTQARCYPAAQAYLARRQAAGKTRREAIRALKRYLVRAIWRQWQCCVGEATQTAGLASQVVATAA